MALRARLTRTTFSLLLGKVHALVGGAVNARLLLFLFLHGFPDHPPTAVPFLEHLAETHRLVAPWLRGYAPSPIVGPYDLDTLAADALALIDRLSGQVDLFGGDWGGAITALLPASWPWTSFLGAGQNHVFELEARRDDARALAA